MDTFLKLILESLLSFTREHIQRARQTASVGANTVEYILIVLGGIAIAGLVIAGITAFVNGKIGELG
ncbi:hypothetical protein V1260_15155 [Brachybacterium sp. J144]|jgi:hypothetical protein|uniref:hypothetical protein n=1 Tax=Brachybacterium sp. J144 TaxID=3116487 RepID=UPI000CD21693|nr:hypothetical protein [Brachybacterium sp. J144]MEE1652118.1 hypothetical protein [Brachybacterium sp. J144]